MPEKSFREAFLHYVWQYQYFHKTDIATSGGETIQVLSSGFYNTNSGPDFQNCRLYLGNLEWHGAVEIHHKSSDWHKHKHTTDDAYNSVILHVVWENDLPIARTDGSLIPCLELKTRIIPGVLEKYQELLSAESGLLCKQFLPKVEEFYIQGMLERSMVERLETKAALILEMFLASGNDWEQTSFQWIGKCFGFKLNSAPFERLCSLLPYQTLRKYVHSSTQTQALLFGVAGLLPAENLQEPYVLSLQKEFQYLKSKHQIEHMVAPSEWKFLRTRPANFPTLRLAQFAAFLQACSSLSDLFLTHASLKEIRQQLQSATDPFWNSHFHFHKKATTLLSGTIGAESIENLVINAIIPLRFAYAVSHDMTDLKEHAMEWLRELKPEKNHFTRYFTEAGIVMSSAFESQACLQLFQGYCERKKCLNCSIGHQIVHPLEIQDAAR